jgi:hypothetical protein
MAGTDDNNNGDKYSNDARQMYAEDGCTPGDWASSLAGDDE